MDTERILLTRGIELCAEWDKCQNHFILATGSYSRNYYDRKRGEVAAQLDELCLISELLGVTSYDNFRERIQGNYDATSFPA